MVLHSSGLTGHLLYSPAPILWSAWLGTIMKTERLLPSFMSAYVWKFNSIHKICSFFFEPIIAFSVKIFKDFTSPCLIHEHKKAGYKFKCLDLWLRLILPCILCFSQIFGSQNTSWDNIANVTSIIFCLGWSSAEIPACSGAAPVRVRWTAIAPQAFSAAAQLSLPAGVLLLLGRVCTIVGGFDPALGFTTTSCTAWEWNEPV